MYRVFHKVGHSLKFGLTCNIWLFQAGITAISSVIFIAVFYPSLTKYATFLDNGYIGPISQPRFGLGSNANTYVNLV